MAKSACETTIWSSTLKKVQLDLSEHNFGVPFADLTTIGLDRQTWPSTEVWPYLSRQSFYLLIPRWCRRTTTHNLDCNITSNRTNKGKAGESDTYLPSSPGINYLPESRISDVQHNPIHSICTKFNDDGYRTAGCILKNIFVSVHGFSFLQSIYYSSVSYKK